MLENGITIHHKGESYPVELNQAEANNFSNLTAILECTPREQQEPRSPEEVKAGGIRYMKQLQKVDSFQTQLKRLTAVSPEQMLVLMAVVELMEFGEGRLCGANWTLAFIGELAGQIVRDGAAAMLERDPRAVLAELSSHLVEHWDWVADALILRDRHPRLFTSAPGEPVAPSVSEQGQRSTAKSRHPKPQKAA